MSGGPRRSARIAEQRAVAEVESTKVAEPDTVADTVEEVSTDTAAASEGQSDLDLVPTGDSDKKKKVDDKSAEALLKGHDLYGPTKDHIPGFLPLPFRLANPLVLKPMRKLPNSEE